MVLAAPGSTSERRAKMRVKVSTGQKGHVQVEVGGNTWPLRSLKL